MILVLPLDMDYKLFNRHCDICKDFRFEIPAINSRYFNSFIILIFI